MTVNVTHLSRALLSKQETGHEPLMIYIMSITCSMYVYIQVWQIHNMLNIVQAHRGDRLCNWYSAVLSINSDTVFENVYFYDSVSDSVFKCNQDMERSQRSVSIKTGLTAPSSRCSSLPRVVVAQWPVALWQRPETWWSLTSAKEDKCWPDSPLSSRVMACSWWCCCCCACHLTLL